MHILLHANIHAIWHSVSHHAETYIGYTIHSQPSLKASETMDSTLIYDRAHPRRTQNPRTQKTAELIKSVKVNWKDSTKQTFMKIEARSGRKNNTVEI